MGAERAIPRLLSAPHRPLSSVCREAWSDLAASARSDRPADSALAFRNLAGIANGDFVPHGRAAALQVAQACISERGQSPSIDDGRQVAHRAERAQLEPCSRMRQGREGCRPGHITVPAAHPSPLIRASAAMAASATKSGPSAASRSSDRIARFSPNRPSCRMTDSSSPEPIGYQSFSKLRGNPSRRSSRCWRISGVSGDGCSSSRSHPCTTGPIGIGSRSGRLCGWFAQ